MRTKTHTSRRTSSPTTSARGAAGQPVAGCARADGDGLCSWSGIGEGDAARQFRADSHRRFTEGFADAAVQDTVRDVFKRALP